MPADLIPVTVRNVLRLAYAPSTMIHAQLNSPLTKTVAVTSWFELSFTNSTVDRVYRPTTAQIKVAKFGSYLDQVGSVDHVCRTYIHF
jgi:hypothetical protein